MLNLESFFKNRGLVGMLRQQFLKNAPDIWGELMRKNEETTTNRVMQGALSSGKGINVAGENSQKRKKLFGFGGFNFDPTKTEDLLGFLLGMLLTRRW